MKCSAAWCVSVVPNISPLHSLKLGKTLLADSVLSCCNAAIDSARRISGPFNSLQWGLGAFRAELGWSVSLGTLLEGSVNARKFRDSRRSLPPSALLPEDWTDHSAHAIFPPFHITLPTLPKPSGQLGNKCQIFSAVLYQDDLSENHESKIGCHCMVV